MACLGVQSFREVLRNIYETQKQRLDVTLLPAASNQSITAHPTIAEVPNPSTTDEERLAVTFKASFESPAGVGMLPRLLTNKFYRRRQEDVMEFLLDSVLNSDQEHAPRLSQACAGLDAPKLVCPHCAWERAAAPEAFTSISLPLRRENSSLVGSVQEALHAYLEPEPVSVDWCCQNEDCPLYNDVDRRPHKRHRISIHPQVLVLHLKRWQTEVRRDGRVRIHALRHAVTPERRITLQGHDYQLKSIVCHLGDSIEHGHYTCFMNFPAVGGAWWYYNDTERRLAAESELATSTRQKSYVLFYEKLGSGEPLSAASASGSAASSSARPGMPLASSLGSATPLQPSQVAAGMASSIGSSSSTGSARTRCPRRALRRSYTMYPADGQTGDLPAPRMGPTVPPWVSSLVTGHMLPEPAAAYSLSDLRDGSGTDLTIPTGVSESDSNIVQQLADMRLESQTAETASLQHRSQPPAMHERPRAMPRASRLPVPNRPRIVTGFGNERVDDVVADEARRVEGGVHRAARRREEGERGRMRDWDNNDLDRGAGGAWHTGRR